MDRDLTYRIKEVFFREESIEKAIDAFSQNLDKVDFDDEDDVQEINELIRTALTYNEKNGDGVKFVEFLVSKGFDLNFKFSKKECLILKLAETAVSPSVFQKLIDMGADVYSETTVGGNVLTRSSKQVFNGWVKADSEKSERLPLYIAEHFDLAQLDHSDEYGITPLMYAVMKNKRNLVETLIRRGSDVNATGGQPASGYSYWMKTYGVSPLAIACREGNLDMAKLLLDAGAEDTLCDAEGTPTLFSLLYSSFDFKKYGVPYQIEIGKRKGEIVKLLKNPDFADSHGNTLLMKSMWSYGYTIDKQISPFNNEGIMSALMECGVNVNAVNNDGKRPIHYAAEYWDRMIKDLLAAGAEIDARDNQGNTALIIVCKNRNEKAARLLVRKGADFTLKNAEGKSAADIAAEKGMTDVLELMM
ncbi:MAG: hypothetical protein HFK09_03830 [Clostridia bacterium]|nr:hypothetical protein [Clostridia bacterium]